MRRRVVVASGLATLWVVGCSPTFQSLYELDACIGQSACPADLSDPTKAAATAEAV